MFSAKEIRQYATKVVNYSTEYGRNSSYTAGNLAGEPKLSGKYGDFTEAFVLRTYGPWWNICPSATRPLKYRPTHFISQDFVELEYAQPVIPSGINILENYHPGAVVRILACNSHVKHADRPGEVRWETLWSGLPQQNEAEKQYRNFSPPLKEIDYPTKLIRLEFNSEGCGYYTELDAVELVGKSPSGHQKKKTDREEGFLTSLTTRLLKHMTLVERQISVEEDTEEFGKWGFFSWLPDEVMQIIFQYLDIVSLSRAAQVCSLFLKHCYDPLFYTELDLQPFWTSVDDVALKGLHSRCKHLQHLSLSWTGGGGLITNLELCNFLGRCGMKLITLRLACCQYISRETLKTIVKECPVLEELDLQSCCQLDCKDLLLLNKLAKLKRLNLYRMQLDENVLADLGNGCTQLEHLNIGSCPKVHSDALDEFVSKLQNLVSLDLWRCKNVSNITMEILASSCPNLQELDLGWCQPIIQSGMENPDQVFSCWPKLRKIFFTCGRAISDKEVEAITRHCPQLEQFDILGSGRVTKVSIENMLKRCTKLQLLDVSFASNIDDQTVAHWIEKYPHVCIKKSFQ